MASGFATREQLSASVLQAARRADLEEVQSLVERWRSDELHPGPTAAELRPAMSSAISNGDARMLSYLLDQDSHIHPNLISCAVRGASVAVWQVFLDHGWDINSISGSEPPILKCVPVSRWSVQSKGRLMSGTDGAVDIWWATNGS